jgi:hypothetical protein
VPAQRPYVRARDQLARFEIAARVPEADLGLVEVRPCEDLAALTG